jgi:hypothetical protein
MYQVIPFGCVIRMQKKIPLSFRGGQEIVEIAQTFTQ